MIEPLGSTWPVVDITHCNIRNATLTGRAGLAGVIEVAVGNTTCAIAEDRTVKCWGWNNHGQLGNGSEVSHSTSPVAVSSLVQVVDLAIGGEFACAVATGQVWCWGRNEYGQLGDGTTADRSTPVSVQGLPAAGAASVVAGEYHACALTNDQKVWCWGLDTWSLAGTYAATPYEVAGLTAVVELRAGGNATCARTTSGQVLCWGRNSNGQLGLGNTTSAATPTLVSWP